MPKCDPAGGSLFCSITFEFVGVKPIVGMDTQGSARPPWHCEALPDGQISVPSAAQTATLARKASIERVRAEEDAAELKNMESLTRTVRLLQEGCGCQEMFLKSGARNARPIIAALSNAKYDVRDIGMNFNDPFYEVCVPDKLLDAARNGGPSEKDS